MPRKKNEEEGAAPPDLRGPKLRITIPLSEKATAEVRSKASCYRGQLTQEGFIALIGAEVEQRLPVILRQIIAKLEGERRQRLGLDKTEDMAPVATEVQPGDGGGIEEDLYPDGPFPEKAG